MSQGERRVGLKAVGIEGASQVHWNLSPANLYEEAVRRAGLISTPGRWSAAPPAPAVPMTVG